MSKNFIVSIVNFVLLLALLVLPSVYAEDNTTVQTPVLYNENVSINETSNITSNVTSPVVSPLINSSIWKPTLEEYYQLRGWTFSTKMSEQAKYWAESSIRNRCVFRQDKDKTGRIYHTVFGVVGKKSDKREICFIPG